MPYYVARTRFAKSRLRQPSVGCRTASRPWHRLTPAQAPSSDRVAEVHRPGSGESHPRGGHHGVHPAPAALPRRRPGSRHRQDDDGDPPRPAPQGLRGQPQRRAAKGTPTCQNKPIEQLLRDINQVPEDIRQKVINNGGGHANHTMFWEIMGPNGGGEPTGPLADAIKSTFTDFAGFKAKIKEAGLGRFGSGWAWLVRRRQAARSSAPPTRTARS